jgi:hypothetical protein
MTITHEQPNERVRVFVDFDPSADNTKDQPKARPVAFVWGKRKYEVKKINLVYRRRQGDVQEVLFAVSDDANSFVLSYNPVSLEWRLEEMMVE